MRSRRTRRYISWLCSSGMQGFNSGTWFIFLSCMFMAFSLEELNLFAMRMDTFLKRGEMELRISGMKIRSVSTSASSDDILYLQRGIFASSYDVLKVKMANKVVLVMLYAAAREGR